MDSNPSESSQTTTTTTTTATMPNGHARAESSSAACSSGLAPKRSIASAPQQCRPAHCRTHAEGAGQGPRQGPGQGTILGRLSRLGRMWGSYQFTAPICSRPRARSIRYPPNKTQLPHWWHVCLVPPGKRGCKAPRTPLGPRKHTNMRRKKELDHKIASAGSA